MPDLIDPGAVTKRSDRFHCERRHSAVSVDGCLTAQKPPGLGQPIATCRTCPVGQAVAVKLGVAAPKPSPSPKPPTPPKRRALPVVPDLVVPADDAAPEQAVLDVGETLKPASDGSEPTPKSPAGADVVAARLRACHLLDEAELTARAHRVSIDEMLGPSRSRSASTARKALAVVLRERWGKSLEEVGYLLGRHHSTVLSMLGSRKVALRGGARDDVAPPASDGARPDGTWLQ